MKNFDVYKHPIHGYEAVKKGFSWPAFFFTWIWAFIKKLWGVGIAFLGVVLILTPIEIALEKTGGAGGVVLVVPILALWFAVKGNELRGNNLMERGFELLQTLKAKTPDAAIASVVKDNAS